jgi:hypothetical protein
MLFKLVSRPVNSGVMPLTEKNFMKRISLYSIIAFITFALGISSALIWWHQKGVDIPSPLGNALEIDYHQLAKEPEKYVGKEIRLRVGASVSWRGSLIEGLLNEPYSPGPVFFGVDYAPESAESFTKAEGALGVDPEDPEGKINSVRQANVVLTGRFIKDEGKKDFIGRTYPYWFIVSRLEYIDGKAR